MVKVKFPLCFWAPRHGGVLESGGIAPRILDLGTRWRWVVSFTPRPLYSRGKSPCYPLDRRLGGLQSRFAFGGEEKNSQPLLGLEPPIIRSVAQLCATELSRLLHFLIALLNFFKLCSARFPVCRKFFWFKFSLDISAEKLFPSNYSMS
jgi:hypothetical protein